MARQVQGEQSEAPVGELAGAGVPLRSVLTRREALQIGATALGSVAAIELDSAGAAAKAGAVPASVSARERSFDEGWRFHRGDASGAEAPSFDDSSWRALDVPHDWSIEDLPYATSDDGAATADPSGFAFITSPSPSGNAPSVIGPFDTQNSAGGRSTGYTVGGVGWYRKHFALARLRVNQHVEVRFDGVYENADVWINGVHLGFHPNGYTSFAFELTPHLKRSGMNVLAVRVDNTGQNSRWYSGSGIYRHTWLTVTGPVRVPLWGVYVTTPVVGEQRSVARVEVSVANLGARASSARVRVRVLDRHGTTVATRSAARKQVAPGSKATFDLHLPIKRGALWSPDSPNLYRVRSDVLVGGQVVDSTITTFGIRSIVMNGKDGFLLNGKPIKVLGGNIHHDHGPLGAVALNRSEERKIEILKAAGFNAIRASHNPRSPAMLDICDRLGMLVWDEFSDMWDVPKSANDYHTYFPDWWQRDLTGMAVRDRNHASVVIWSVGNEILVDPTNGQRGQQMADLIRSLDRTRPVSVGGFDGLGSSDSQWQYVDVGDVHYNSDYSSVHAAHPEKAMTQSESYPSTIYDDWKFSHDNAWSVGNWVWAAWDYIGEAGCGAPPFNPIGAPAAATVYAAAATGGAIPYPWFQDFQGDIDLIGQRKPQNYWRAVVYGLSPVEMAVERPPPPGTEQRAALWGYYDELRSWTWDVPQGQAMKVRVYASGDSVKLLLNGTEVGTNSLVESDKRSTTFSVPYAPGELTAIASHNGGEIGRKTLATTGSPAAVRLISDVKALTTSRDDLAHVLVEVVDSQGRLVPDAVIRVSFGVSGAGELVGVGNGNPHNVDSFKRPKRYTWHGQALAILRPAKKPGSIRLTASAPGLQTASLTLAVKLARKPAHRPTKKRHPRATLRLPARTARTAASLAGLGSGPLLLYGAAAALLRRRLQQGASPGRGRSPRRRVVGRE
jgi:beta-galactosidase